MRLQSDLFLNETVIRSIMTMSKGGKLLKTGHNFVEIRRIICSICIISGCVTDNE